MTKLQLLLRLRSKQPLPVSRFAQGDPSFFVARPVHRRPTLSQTRFLAKGFNGSPKPRDYFFVMVRYTRADSASRMGRHCTDRQDAPERGHPPTQEIARRGKGADGMKNWLQRAGLTAGVLSGLGAGLGRAAAITVALAIGALVILALVNQTYPIITTNPFRLTWKRIERSSSQKGSATEEACGTAGGRPREHAAAPTPESPQQ